MFEMKMGSIVSCNDRQEIEDRFLEKSLSKKNLKSSKFSTKELKHVAINEH